MAGTIAWHGVKNVGIVLQAQREIQKVSCSACVSVTCFRMRVGNAARRESPTISREDTAIYKHNYDVAPARPLYDCAGEGPSEPCCVTHVSFDSTSTSMTQETVCHLLCEHFYLMHNVVNVAPKGSRSVIDYLEVHHRQHAPPNVPRP